MNPKSFKSIAAGKVVRTATGYHAFIPAALPPVLEFDAQFAVALSRADAALSELSGLGRVLPNPHLLISPLLRREAVLSSRIEGTRASLSDLFADEAKEADAPRDADIREVSNYVVALEYGIERVKTFPLSLRLVTELHGHLMQAVRGEHSTPGEFRRSQNWIGAAGSNPATAAYVPPPPEEMMELLGNWEIFLHDRESLPDLVVCAVMHQQFEAIHPFLDGNGRVGRLLISLFLIERERLSQPLLYLSSFIESRRQEYYDLLQRVRTDGDWTSWLRWFLKGVELTARDAARRAAQLLDLREQYRRQLSGRATAISVLDRLFINPYITIRQAADYLKTSQPTAAKAIAELQRQQIVAEFGDRRWRRLYLAHPILEVLEGPMD
jgi:Fic family protein